jgi:hypothetical protein
MTVMFGSWILTGSPSEQVHVLGHHNVAGGHKAVPRSRLSSCVFKQVAGRRCAKC